MKTSKAFSFIVAFLLFAIATGVTWVVARSDGGSIGEKTTNTDTYLPIVLRPVDPLVLEMERDALVALYQSTNGDEWNRSSGWLGPNDHCSWHGVDCSGGRVTGLVLDFNQLDGPIPKELGNLGALQELVLYGNQLTGAIPKELGNLSMLESLALFENQLTGPIPKELGNLSSLEALRLSYNQLTGPIPKELGNLKMLENLELIKNQLSGPIPPELGNLSNLSILNLYLNQLSGPIPKELSNLSNIWYFTLQKNQLSCWETSDVLEWALKNSGNEHNWDYPTPGETVCP